MEHTTLKIITDFINLNHYTLQTDGIDFKTTLKDNRIPSHTMLNVIKHYCNEYNKKAMEFYDTLCGLFGMKLIEELCVKSIMTSSCHIVLNKQHNINSIHYFSEMKSEESIYYIYNPDGSINTMSNDFSDYDVRHRSLDFIINTNNLTGFTTYEIVLYRNQNKQIPINNIPLEIFNRLNLHFKNLVTTWREIEVDFFKCKNHIHLKSIDTMVDELVAIRSTQRQR